ncbi:MAG: hypothetical protein WBG90_00970 [Saonia sp.]
MIKNLFRIALKFVLGTALFLLVAFGILYIAYNEPLPKTEESFEADMLANKMLKALDHEAYKNTRYLEWSFRNGAHEYVWDKKLGLVDVKWDNYSVALHLNNTAKSRVYKNGREMKDDSKSKLLKKAISLFNNDSFWLVAPFKVFDKGTKRSIVTLEDGSRGLLVNYTSGGTTPGDAYLWKLGEDSLPKSYQMWVKIIPIGGIEATWNNWQRMESGVFLPKTHELGPITLDMGNIKGYN